MKMSVGGSSVGRFMFRTLRLKKRNMFKDFTVKRLEYLPCVSVSELSKDTQDTVKIQSFVSDNKTYNFSFTNMSFYGKITVLHLLDDMNILAKQIWW